MSEIRSARALITREDLRSMADITESRYRSAELESERTMLARRFLGAALGLEQTLRAHTRCALVNHCGSVGANNLSDATAALFAALSEYASAVREMAARFRNVHPAESMPRDNAGAESRAPLLNVV
ncbi:MAG: hypothetical protein ACT443_14350 [Gemmatimonadota bacterium]